MSNIQYFSLDDAIKANETAFYTAVQDGVERWLNRSSTEQVHAALFEDEQAEAQRIAA